MPRSARDEVELRGLDQPQEDVFDVLAHVARLGQRGRIGDAEGNVEDLREGLSQQRLSAAGRADQQDVRLLQLDVVDLHPGVDPLVVVVDRDRENLLGALLPNHVLIEKLDDAVGCGNLRRRLYDSDVCGACSSSMISRQSSTHSSQM